MVLHIVVVREIRTEKKKLLTFCHYEKNKKKIQCSL